MQITLRSDGREIKSHGDYAFPVLVSPERLDAYEMGSFACHWHPEIEFTLILTGEILYQVNDRTYHLKKGDGVFCNANMLHTGRHADNHDCTYLSVTVNPSLLYGYEASLLQTKFIQPVTENPLLPSASFSREVPWEREVLSHLDTIRHLWQEPPRSYELRLLTELYQIWILLFDHLDLDARPSSGDVRELERLRRIVTFIHGHYMEHISLEDISGCVNMCKSECCRLFRRFLHQSPIDYVISCRITAAMSMLAKGGLSMTEIAEQTGFQSSSYFSETFKRLTGMTPSAYKKINSKNS